MIRDGTDERLAARKTLRQRLNRILEDIRDVVPFDGVDWVGGTVEAYNGLKHANRSLPNDLDLINRWQESVLALRLWTAVELGVAPDALAQRARDDEQAEPWIPVREPASEAPPVES
jgi:hypothetical protein